MLRNNRRFALASVAALFAALLAGVAVWASTPDDENRSKLALFSTLPIYWGEVGDMADMLSGDTEQHWVRGALEQEYRLVPLDALTAEPGDDFALDKFDRIIMAQPRALSAAENVALDNWVRGGGHVLLFADPMLTRHSQYSIGDRRRSQDVILLSPILARWGLELRVDDDDQGGERLVQIGKTAMPVNLPGSFVPHVLADGSLADCGLIASGLIADCSIGKGRALILADAAVLESHPDEANTLREQALQMLIGRAFDLP